MAVYQVILRSAGEMEATPAAWAPLPLHPALEEEAAIEPSVYAWLAAAVDAAPCPTTLEDFVESYPMPKQRQIIVACMALHNFIRERHIADKDFDRCDHDENYVPPEASTSQPPTRSTRARDKD